MNMKRRTAFALSFVLLATVFVLAGNGTLRLGHAQSAPAACDGAVVGSPADTPWQYVAIFSYDCAREAPIGDKDARINFALDYGYPSLLIRDIGVAASSEIVAAAIAEGDRGFFAADPEIAGIVAQWPEDMRPDGAEAFLATLSGATTPQGGAQRNGRFRCAPARLRAAMARSAVRASDYRVLCRSGLSWRDFDVFRGGLAGGESGDRRVCFGSTIRAIELRAEL